MIPFYLFSEICQYAPNPHKIKGFCHFFNLFSLLFIRFYKKYPWIVNTFFPWEIVPTFFCTKTFSIFSKLCNNLFFDARILCWIHRVSRYSPTPRASLGFGSLHAKKNVPWHILAPRRGCFGNHLPLRRVRIPVARFYFIGRIFLWNKNASCHWGMAAG